jgi:hypothetical protein
MTDRMVKRCASAVLCVLLVSLLAPAFAQGAVTAHDQFEHHVTLTPSGDDAKDHHAHQHGHDLSEHDNLGHLLDHLTANLEPLPAIMAPDLSPTVSAKSAPSILSTTPSFLFRPPRLSTLT